MKTENTLPAEAAHQNHKQCEENTVSKNWLCYLTIWNLSMGDLIRFALYFHFHEW